MNRRKIMYVRTLRIVIPCLVGIGFSLGNALPLRAEGLARVTLMSGTPRLAGQPLRALQPILTGQELETGESDAVGVLSGEVVLHVGGSTRISSLREDANQIEVRLDRGFLVVHVTPTNRRRLVVTTPFGQLAAQSDAQSKGAGSRFSVRHDPPLASNPAASIFSVLEGHAEARGVVPVTDLRPLATGQQWYIVQGHAPEDPVAADMRAEADSLRGRLHYGAADTVRSQSGGTEGLASMVALGPSVRLDSFGAALRSEGQLLIDNNTALLKDTEPETQGPPVAPVDLGPIRARWLGPAEGVTVVAELVSYSGAPTTENWADFLPSVDSNPAFRPEYFDSFENGGFSYLQFAGLDAQTVTSGGELFLTGGDNGATGWAVFTPQYAVADTAFDLTSPLVDVVTQGFRTIARGDHLASGGTIGGAGAGDPSAFVQLEDGHLTINDALPVGFPLLRLADDTTGLDANGALLSDELAAIGAGLNPLDLSQEGQRLLFISDSNVDALGNTVNAANLPIGPTDLNLPLDRSEDIVRDGQLGISSQGIPLQADQRNTVGIQFAPQGTIVAVIHHTGLRNVSEGTTAVTAHFEVVREGQSSVVRWREGARPTGDGGAPLELVDLNSSPELRNELFVALGEEVNLLVPSDTHTIFGPAVEQPGIDAATAQRQLVAGRLTRTSKVAERHEIGSRRQVVRHKTTGLRRTPAGRPGGGRLVRSVGSEVSRRHVGRTTGRR